MPTAVITNPNRLPVSLSDLKTHLRVSNTASDDYLYTLVLASTSLVENFTNRKLVYQTIKVFYDQFPCSGEIKVPFGQLKSVTHVKYTDSNDDQSTFSTDYYSVDTDSDPGRIVLNYGESWPTDTLKTNNPIEIQFVCGYYSGDYWEADTAYEEDDYAEPTNANGNGLVYQVSVAADDKESDSSEPSWPAVVGGTVVDNDLTWTCVGDGVPKAIRQAILVQATDYFKMREPYIVGVSHKPLRTVQALLWPYRIFV